VKKSARLWLKDVSLFGGHPLFIWTFGPLSIICGFIVAHTAYAQFATGHLSEGFSFIAVEILCVCFFLALLNLPHFWWAGRVAAATIVCICLSNVFDKWFIHPSTLRIGLAESEPTLGNALVSFVLFGTPCLCYAVLGRFTIRAPPPRPRDPMEGLKEFSTDFDIEWVRPFLDRIQPFIDSGFGPPQIEVIQQVVATMRWDESTAFQFRIHYADKDALLMVNVYKEDVDTVTIWFYAPPTLCKQIEEEMMRFAEELGV
jgi:hypothetical protein